VSLSNYLNADPDRPYSVLMGKPGSVVEANAGRRVWACNVDPHRALSLHRDWAILNSNITLG